MCGRFTLSTSGEEVARHFALAEVPELGPRYNIAPTQEVGAVRLDPDGGREWAWLRWGLVPSWADDPSIGARMINARSETVASKPAFRRAFRRHRCLVPADGFYEWSGTKGARRAHHVRRRDGGLFAIAGLWERWHDPEEPDAPALESLSLLTTEANATLRPLHGRMPVILAERDYGAWLGPEPAEPEGLQALLVPSPPDLLQVDPVGPRVNDARHEGPECLEPAEDAAP